MTPGRWHINDLRHQKNGKIEILSSRDGDYRHIANVLLNGLIVHERPQIPMEDARLISAAPELLAACRISMAILDEFAVHDIVGALVLDSVRAQLRAALEKAETR